MEGWGKERSKEEFWISQKGNEGDSGEKKKGKKVRREGRENYCFGMWWE